MTRLLVAEPTSFKGDLIATALDAEAWCRVVGIVTDLAHIDVEARKVDVVLLSMAFSPGDALDATRKLVASEPGIRVIAIGIPDSEPAILHAIEAGASGYVLETDSLEKLRNVVRSVSDHDAYAAPNIVAVMMRRLRERVFAPLTPPDERRFDELTEREHEILHLLAAGLSNRAIAERLFIEYGTVKNHVHNILNKLGVGSRHEAATCLAYA
ncbi:MAG: response regulator transcription factor [Rhodothermales bacterium]